MHSTACPPFKEALVTGPSAALESAGTGVRVNVIAPGPIETPMLNRFTKPGERKAGLVSEAEALFKCASFD